MNRIIVLGGGIVGASAAFHLARDGVETVLVDEQHEGRATSAGAGIVAPGTTLRETPGFFDLATPAAAYYPELVASLVELDAGETGYEVCGKLFLAETEDDVALMDATLALFRERQATGVPNVGDIEDMDGTAAKSLFPALKDVPRALYTSGAARVDGAKMRDAMIAAATGLGARLVNEAARLDLLEGRVVGIKTNSESIAADAVVLASGSWSNELFRQLGFSLPVAPQKGQILHILMPGESTSHWPILGWYGDQYILTFGPNRVVCGATREFNSGFDTRVTPAGVKHVLDTALRIAPGLAHGTLHEVRVGLRPFAEDGLPYLGLAPGFDNVVVATGHGPSGLQLGPYSGRIAAELAAGRKPSSDISAFNLERGIQEITR